MRISDVTLLYSPDVAVNVHLDSPCPRFLRALVTSEIRTAGRLRLLRSRLFFSPVNERSVLAHLSYESFLRVSHMSLLVPYCRDYCEKCVDPMLRGRCGKRTTEKRGRRREARKASLFSFFLFPLLSLSLSLDTFLAK